MKRIILGMMLVFAATWTLGAQTETSRSEQAEVHEEALRQGGLVVRLPSNHRKLTTMYAYRDTATLSDQDRRRLDAMIEDTETSTLRQNRLLVAAFRTYFEEIPVIFVYDTARLDAPRGMVLTDSLELDPQRPLPTPSFLTARIGYTDPAQTARAEALILGDAQMRDLQPPFPTAVAFNNFGLLLNLWLNPSTAESRRINQAVDKLYRRLQQAKSKW